MRRKIPIKLEPIVVQGVLNEEGLLNVEVYPIMEDWVLVGISIRDVVNEFGKVTASLHTGLFEKHFLGNFDNILVQYAEAIQRMVDRGEVLASKVELSTSVDSNPSIEQPSKRVGKRRRKHPDEVC